MAFEVFAGLIDQAGDYINGEGPRLDDGTVLSGPELPPLPEGYHYEFTPDPNGGPDTVTIVKGEDGVDGGFVRDPVSGKSFWVTGKGHYGWVTGAHGNQEYSWILDSSHFRWR